MAVLNKIRQRSVFLIIIIALALFSFVLADVIRNGGFSSDKSQSTVATINGTDIDRQSFMEEVEAYQRQVGPNSNSSQAMNVIWEQKLRKTLMQEQFDELGLTVGEDQLDDAMSTALQNNPTFQDETGTYSQAKVLEYVAAIKGNQDLYSQWLNFIENTKANILQTNYMNLIKGGMASTVVDGEQEYRFENDKINIEYVQVPYSKIADTDVEVTESEIAAYTKAHADEFEVEPMADIQYVSFSETPSTSDVAAAKDEISKLLNDRYEYGDTIPGFGRNQNYVDFVNTNSDESFVDQWVFKSGLPEAIRDSLFDKDINEVYGPYQLDNTYNIAKVVETRQMADSVDSRHILIRFAGLQTAAQDVTRTKEDAQSLADSLSAVLNRNSGKFEELAGTFSEDLSNKDDGGDLGVSWYGRMVGPFNDFIYDSPEGTIGVVETRFGFHVVDVKEKKNIQKAVKVAVVAKEIEASEKTLNDVFADATGFEVAAQAGDFSAVSEEKNLTTKPVNKIGKLDANIPGIGNNRSIVNWAFEDQSKVGDVKRFNIPDGYVIVQLTRKNDKKALMSVAEASARVTPILRNEKKAAKIREAISGTTLQEVATSQNVTVKNATALTMAAPTIAGAGSEPKVVGAAFGLAAGETTELIDGATGVFMVRVLAVNKAPDLQSYESYVNQLTTKALPAVNNGVYQALKNSADIEDNRATFF